MTDTINVYVGTDRSQALAVDVLEYSIRRHTNSDVQMHSMLGLELPAPADVREGQRTGFSFARWAIPELAGYAGRAIYVDADMLVMRDIAELHDVALNGAKVALLEPREDVADNVHYNPNETSVMVLDCARCDWKLKDLVDGLGTRYHYKEMMSAVGFLEEADIARTIPASWNSMEHVDTSTGLLHYTLMPTQPWVSARNPLGYLWFAEVKRMLADGALALSRIEEEVRLGYFRPSLLEELDDEATAPPSAERMAKLERIDHDAGFVAHRELGEFDRKRLRAVADYERRLSWQAGLGTYARHVSREMYLAARARAGAVKRRLLSAPR